MAKLTKQQKKIKAALDSDAAWVGGPPSWYRKICDKPIPTGPKPPVAVLTYAIVDNDGMVKEQICSACWNQKGRPTSYMSVDSGAGSCAGCKQMFGQTIPGWNRELIMIDKPQEPIPNSQTIPNYKPMTHLLQMKHQEEAAKRAAILGGKEIFPGGAVRDSQEGKTRYDLIPVLPLKRLADHYTKGAKTYGEYNWQKGMPFKRIIASVMRHLFSWVMGDRSEDHLAAIVFGCFAIMHFEETKRDELNDYKEPTN